MVTYSGSGTNSGIKLYLNNILKPYTTGNSGTYTSMGNTTSTMNFGQETAGGGAYRLNGLLDEISIYNTEASATERNLIWNGGTGTTL